MLASALRGASNGRRHATHRLRGINKKTISIGLNTLPVAGAKPIVGALQRPPPQEAK